VTALSIGCCFSGAASALAIPLDFVNITDMPLGPGSGTTPSINDNNDVAFRSGSDIYFYNRSDDSFLNIMTLPGAPTSAWAPRLNAGGDILMIDNATRDPWLYLADTQAFIDLATLPGYPGNTQANDLNAVFDLNDARQVSFHSGDNNFGDVYLYEHATGAFTRVTGQPGGAFSGRSNKINDLGQVAYGSVGITGAPVFVYDIASQITTNISSLPGGPGSGLGALSFSDSGGVAMFLNVGPVLYDASAASFLNLASLPGYPAGNASVDYNGLSASGDYTFWHTEIYYFDTETQTFTQLTNVPGVTPAGGSLSSINNNGVAAFTAGFFGAEDIFLAIPPCPADINSDGVVNTADLGALIGAFGTTSSAADINGDGIVDTADLGLLIADFGQACP